MIKAPVLTYWGFFNPHSMATKHKTFIQLTDKDSIYYVSPVTLEIEGFKIKTISGIEPEKVLHRPVLKRWVKIEVFLSTPIFQSPDIEKVPTQVFYFDGDQKAQVAISKVQMGKGHNVSLPVLFTPNLDLLKEWQRQ